MGYVSKELSALEERCLQQFPEWLNNLPADALRLLEGAVSEATPTAVRAELLSALNYLFKSLDLIPDGIEELGYLDDALVFRVAVDNAAAQGELPLGLEQLKGDTALVQEFLADEYERLPRYVQTLKTVAVRGRSPDQLVAAPEVLSEFSDDVRSWAESYAAPAFARDDKNLVRLRSFLLTKLPV